MQTQMVERRLSGLLVMHPANWYYLSGFSGEAGALLLLRRGPVLVTDGRFTAQAKGETSGIRVVAQKGSLTASVGAWLKTQRRSRIGFDASQLTVAQLRALRAAAGRKVQWIAASGAVEALRARKEPQEIAQMRKAGVLAGEVLAAALKLLKPGVRELEIAAEIEYQMRQRGASGRAFETIVAFGERSAYPHARPTAKRLRKNELVVLDLGAILGHYCSDITRTVFVGRAPARVRRWYRAVQEAQSAAIAAVKAGVRCGDVDAAARQILTGHGLDRYFIHSTGHGLGLEVHEDPRVARGQKQILVPGNVITIEPGVYIPGVGGIRIEDDVAVRADRTEVLTRVPRDLIEI
ncbi:MAG TPA: Xaa-Pro peptidase family protein [Candidatus Limnocylindria bacterium]|nr:Xaa-Pro peptidase family protein [Candidatus Limnocylindria bacterium]